MFHLRNNFDLFIFLKTRQAGPLPTSSRFCRLRTIWAKNFLRTCNRLIKMAIGNSVSTKTSKFAIEIKNDN